MTYLVSIRGLLAAALIIACPVAAFTAESTPPPIVLIIIEGLRPESITKHDMPTLHRLSRSGQTSTNHHAVYPMLASVNAASLATGAYPSHHGIVGDQFIDPQSGDPITAKEASLGVPSLGAILAKHGMRARVMGAPRAIANYFATSTNEVVSSSNPTSIVDSYLQLLGETQLDLAVLWFDQGNEVPMNHAALRTLDQQLSRIIARHESPGHQANLMVTSSHRPMSNAGEPILLSKKLVDQGWKAAIDSKDVRVLGGNAIYVQNHDRPTISKIATWLQRQPWADAIFTQQVRPTHPEGFVPGVLSFHAVYMDHPNAPDILVEGARSGCDDATTVDLARSNPDTYLVPLILAGPDFKKRSTSNVPSGHCDLAPTIEHLLGLEPPSTNNGRVLHETLRGGPNPKDITVLRRRHGSQARWEGGHYQIMMQESTVDHIEYLDNITVTK